MQFTNKQTKIFFEQTLKLQRQLSNRVFFDPYIKLFLSTIFF